MDSTKRQLTKVAREATRYAAGRLRKSGIGSTEYECLRIIRKQGGIRQEQLGEQLNIDKAAVTRMVQNLVKKGYVIKERDPADRRSNRLFATEKALEIKLDETDAESLFYEWLLEDIPAGDAAVFLRVLDELYHKSKQERRDGFVNVSAWAEARVSARGKNAETEEK